MVGTCEKILLVEDDEDILMMIEYIVADAGYQVFTASSGLEAIELIKTHDFDLALCDLNMPGINGLGVYESFKARFLNSPFIIFSGSVDQKTEEELIKKGVYCVLPKPLPMKTLVLAITDALASGKKAG